jgi:hypothetical protein
MNIRITLILVTFLASAMPSVAARHAAISARADTAQADRVSSSTEVDVARLPIAFEPNVGQKDGNIRFSARASGYVLDLTPNEDVFALGRGSEVRVRFEGSAGARRFEGDDELPGRSNYFVGNDPTTWRANVPTYANVVARDVYPGIDAVYRSESGALEYDFRVAPGGDAHQIVLAIRGARRLEVNSDGDLVVETESGALRQRRPLAYQDVDGVRRMIPVRFTVDSDARIRFRLGAYDTSKPVTIDPVVSFSSYLGGSGTDGVAGVTVDAQGNAYLVGGTDSSNFPTTPGVLQPTYSGSLSDAFVTKIDAAGTAVLYSTYLGGSGDDAVARVTVDASGNAYLVGGTSSTNFPTTPGALQTSFRGGSFDGFVTKLNATGSALLASTYLGGGGDEGVAAIALDATGNMFVTGAATSTNFPTTPGAFDTSGGNFLGIPDAFVTKLNASATGLVYSTYAGASFNLDGGVAIAVNAAGNAFVAGATNGGFPTTGGAFQPNSRGNFDGFALELNPAGSALVYSTYVGGSGEDYCFGLALDGSNNVYLTGYTDSTNFPLASPLQASLAGGFDAFVTKVNPSGSALVYSTYIGGSGNEGLSSNGGPELQIAGAIAVDSAGNALVTGFTDSTDFPTVGAFQPTNGGGFDAWVAKVAPTGASLAYASYLGGSLEERGLGIAVDGAGDAVVSGLTFSTNFPTTPGAFQPTGGGGTDVTDGFVVKISSAGSTDTPGIYIGSTGGWFLRNSNSNGNADTLFGYGPAGDGLIALSGDWDGDGDDTPGLYNPATAAFFLKNSSAGGPADITIVYGPGNAGFVPLVGDWDGDGDDTVGVFDPVTSAFFLRNSNTNGNADILFGFGPPNGGHLPLAGDWDGNGTDTPGIYNRTTGTFFLKNSSAGGPADLAFSFGPAGVQWVPLVGDWDGAGGDTIGLYDPASAGWFLRNSNTSGIADVLFVYGPPNSVPLAGDWDGL